MHQGCNRLGRRAETAGAARPRGRWLSTRAAATWVGGCAALVLSLWASSVQAAPVSPLGGVDACAAALCSLPLVAVSEARQSSQCPRPARVAAEPDDASAADDSWFVVPICLIEGASGIAPLLVHQIDGGRIESRQGCGEELPWPQLLLPQGGDQMPVDASDGSAAAIAPAGIVPSRRAGSLEELPRQLPYERREPAHGGRVYRPPRR